MRKFKNILKILLVVVSLVLGFFINREVAELTTSYLPCPPLLPFGCVADSTSGWPFKIQASTIAQPTERVTVFVIFNILFWSLGIAIILFATTRIFIKNEIR